MSTKNSINVLIIDDSPLKREALTSILNSDPVIQVIGTANDGREGLSKAKTLKPDVISMDLNMPKMDGIETTERIMQEIPTPIIIVSTMEVDLIIKAMGHGAMDFVSITQSIENIAEELIEKVKIASRVRPLRRMKKLTDFKSPPHEKKSTHKVITIGISTGGPQAIQIVLSQLPSDFPGSILIVQHMSKGFIQGLADWLRTSSKLSIQVAGEGSSIQPATVLLAPDDFHMQVGRDGQIRLTADSDFGTAHIPSIDVLMKSAASSFQSNAMGILMTGMGRDGVEGIREIKRAGGATVAQDEQTSVIFGMNKIAIDKGYINRVVPLAQIADEIKQFANI